MNENNIINNNYDLLKDNNQNFKNDNVNNI